MGLGIWFEDRANEIYKKVEDQKPLRGRNQDAILAACLYIACRQEDKPRTVKGMISNTMLKKHLFLACIKIPDMWISIRNMLCCQWSHKERNWSCKRVYREAIGGGDGSIHGNGNNTCWGLSGEFGAEITHHLIAVVLSFPYTLFLSVSRNCSVFRICHSNHWHPQIYRDVSAPILVWVIKQLRLLKKLYKNLKSWI